jgi:hypothetical protein
MSSVSVSQPLAAELEQVAVLAAAGQRVLLRERKLLGGSWLDFSSVQKTKFESKNRSFSPKVR